MGTSPEVGAGKATQLASIVNFIVNILGAALLSMPYTLLEASWGGGALIFVLLCGLNACSVVVISRCCELAGTFSYREAGEKAFGDWFGILITVVVACYTTGSLVSYMVLIGDFLPDALQGMGLPADWFDSRAFLVATVLVVLLTPLALLPDLRLLSATSSGAVVCILVAAGVIVARAASGPIERPHDGFSVSTGWFGAMAIVNVAFCLHYNVGRYYEELKDRSLLRIGQVAAVSFGICLVLYLVTASAGYWAFGPVTDGDVLNNLGTNSTSALIARLALAVSTSLTVPLALHPLRAAIHSLTPDKWCGVSKLSTGMWTALTIGLLLIVYTVGVLETNVEEVLSYKGALFGSPLVFILPGLMLFALEEKFGDGSSDGLNPARAAAINEEPGENPFRTLGSFDELDNPLLAGAGDEYEGLRDAGDAAAPAPKPARRPLQWKRLCSTRHGLIATVFIIWGSVIMVLGTLHAAGVF